MKVEFQSFQSAPGGEAGGNEKSRIHSSPAARQGQADRRGPRGGLEINGSGQAGGAISRIGWGCMRESLLSRHCIRQYVRVNQGERSQTRHAVHASANDVPFLIISFGLRNPSRFVCRGSRHGRVRVGTGTLFLVRVRLKNRQTWPRYWQCPPRSGVRAASGRGDDLVENARLW